MPSKTNRPGVIALPFLYVHETGLWLFSVSFPRMFGPKPATSVKRDASATSGGLARRPDNRTIQPLAIVRCPGVPLQEFLM